MKNYRISDTEVKVKLTLWDVKLKALMFSVTVPCQTWKLKRSTNVNQYLFSMQMNENTEMKFMKPNKTKYKFTSKIATEEMCSS